MKKQGRLKLTEGFKISKNTSVIPSYTRDLYKAAEILKSSGVVIFPTDTVYGIGCRYDNREAIDRIYRIKKTPKDQPFPVLVSNVNQIRRFAKVTQVAQKLIKKYWPGGLTIILKTLDGTKKIGFRMPDNSLVRSLIGQIGVPIIGTSANFHGQKAPKSFDKLDPEFVKLADFTVEGECEGGIESTVVDATVNPPKILRQGAVDINLINSIN